MKTKSFAQQGFTLVELVIVIVILGILSAVAIPKFIDLSKEASTAATEGVASNLTSATSINYAKKKLGSAGAITLNQTNVCTNTILQPFVNGVTLVSASATPATNKEFKVSGTGDCSVATAEYVTCQVQGKDAPAAVNALIQCAR